MFIRRLLFETKLGEWLLVLLESYAGLAVVQANQLAMHRCGKPLHPPRCGEIADG